MLRTTKEEDDKRQKLYEKRLLQQQKSQQRQREKQLQRLNDPVYQQEQRDKQCAAQQRQALKQQQRQHKKLQDPEFQQQQRMKQQQLSDKQKAKAGIRTQPLSSKPAAVTAQTIEKKRQQQHAMQLRMLEKQQQKPVNSPLKKVIKSIKSKGLKGRNPNTEEKRLASKIAQIGCICCLNKGWTQTQDYLQSGQNFISLHHVEGRVKPWAHAKVLPLCHYHHQTPAPAHAPTELFPLHGNAKPHWEKVNGTQEHLLKQVYAMAEETRPWINLEVAEPA